MHNATETESASKPPLFDLIHRRIFEALGVDANRATASFWYAARALWWVAGVSFSGAMLAGHFGVPEELGRSVGRVFPAALVSALGLSIYIAMLQHYKVASLDAEIAIEKGGGSGLTHADRVALLQTESDLLQSRFDKYDTLVFQLRGWVMTIGVGAVTAYYVVEGQPAEILYVASAAVAGFGILERRWRLDWNDYVQRYKFLRRLLHEDVELGAISPLDLTNKYRRDEREEAFERRFGSILGLQLAKANAGPDHSFPQSTAREMLLFYGIILGALLYLAGLLRT